jgi:hypothetical protein
VTNIIKTEKLMLYAINDEIMLIAEPNKKSFGNKALRNLLPCSRGMFLKTVGATIEANNINAPSKKEINMINRFILISKKIVTLRSTRKAKSI